MSDEVYEQHKAKINGDQQDPPRHEQGHYIEAIKGGLIRKHSVVAAVDPLGDVPGVDAAVVDNLTTHTLSGLSGMAAAQRSDVVDTLAMCYEKGYTETQIAKAIETFFDDAEQMNSTFISKYWNF